MKTKFGLLVLLFFMSISTLFSQVSEDNSGGNRDNKSKGGSVTARLGAFVGVSNSVFLSDVKNDIGPIAGVDFEVLDPVNLRRHSLVIQLKQNFENGDNKLSATQFSFNYRFKFIQSPKFDVYVNAKFASYTYVKREVTTTSEAGSDFPFTVVEQRKGGDFTAPGAFGLGADYKVGNGYITFNYNDIVAIGLDSNGEFPTEFTLGYKFNL